MCSTPVQRIAEIGQAIDDLAAQARSAYTAASRPDEQGAEHTAARPTAGSGPGLTEPGTADSADQIVVRLAELWAQLAQLDPEVARRMPTYEA